MPAGVSRAAVRPVDPVLTRWMVVQAQRETAFIADIAFPPDYREGESSGTFFRATDGFRTFGNQDIERAPGAPFERLSFGLTSATFRTQSFGVEIPIDDDLAAESQTPMQLSRLATIRGMREIMVRREVRVAAACFVTGVWTSETTIAGGSEWDAAAGDALGNIWTCKRQVLLDSGQDANAAILGYDTFRVAVQNGDLQSLMPDAQRVGQLTELQLAANLREAFEVETLMIGRSVRVTSREGATEVAGFTWTDNALFYHKGEGAEGDGSPGAFAQFASTSGGSPTVVETYRDEGILSDVVRVRENRDEVVVDPDQGHLLINCAA